MKSGAEEVNHYRKIIYRDDPVPDMNAALDSYRTLHDLEPSGFILGPNEFLNFIMARGKTSPDDQVPLLWRGLPVRCKRSPGIELEVAPNDAGYFCLGDEVLDLIKEQEESDEN